jgi:hypothetical protein
MQRPNARRVQLDLFYDYRTNVGLYPNGRHSCGSGSRRRSCSGARKTPSSPRKAATRLTDLPKAEMHRLAAGHFALEDSVGEIAEGIRTASISPTSAGNFAYDK